MYNGVALLVIVLVWLMVTPVFWALKADRLVCWPTIYRAEVPLCRICDSRLEAELAAEGSWCSITRL